jgi:hypothetical protein
MRNIFEIIENTWSRTNQSQDKNQWLYGIFEESTAEMMSDKSIQEIQFNFS